MTPSRQEIIDNFINERQGLPPKGASSFSVSGVYFGLKYFRLRASELGWTNGVQTIAPQPTGFVEQAIRAEAAKIHDKIIGLQHPCNGASTNKYHRQIIGICGQRATIDVYRVLHAFPTGLPEIDHAVKKLLAPGMRGAKDRLQDLREAAQSIECAIKYLEQTADA